MLVLLINVESISKPRFDPKSGTYTLTTVPWYHGSGITQAMVPSGTLIPGVGDWFSP